MQIHLDLHENATRSQILDTLLEAMSEEERTSFDYIMTVSYTHLATESNIAAVSNLTSELKNASELKLANESKVERESNLVTLSLEVAYNGAPFSGFARQPGPVSYTHLDVYKRQRIRFARI